MLIPTGTDAPLYHWPIATAGIVAVNLLVFVSALTGDIANADAGTLWWGEGLLPDQWVTSHFIHADISHLLGNMFFLWPFALIIEGKVGWWRFLVIYFTIGILQAGGEQIVMLGYSGPHGGSLGASAILLGLISISAVWAPKNELSFIFIVLFRPYPFEIPVAIFGAIYVGWQMLAVMLWGGSAVSEMLHLSGALVGLAVGVLFLKCQWVDCDGWDFFSIRRDLNGEDRHTASRQSTRQAPQPARVSFDDQEFHRRLRQFLEQGNVEAALKLREKVLATGHRLPWLQKDLFDAISLLHKQKEWRASAPLMAECLEIQDDDRVRLKLAQICVLHLERPGRALDLITPLKTESLQPDLVRAREQIVRKAEAMQAAGTVELDDDSW